MKNKALKKIRNTFLIVLIRIIQFVFFFIPWRPGAKIGEWFGLFLFNFFRKEREVIYRNLDIVYGGSMNRNEKKKFAKQNFRNYGRGFFEFVKFTVWKPEKTASLIKEVEGFELFEKATKEKKGLIGVTGHFSNWELIPVFCKLKGINVGVIGKRLFDDRLDKIVNSTRTKTGVKIFDKDNISKALIKELRNGMLLGILADQDTSVESGTIPFLGRDAKTPVAPAILAKKFNLYLCTLFAVRRPDGYYKMVINKPYEINNETEIKELASKYNDDISEMIRKYPHQWAWIHRRWRTTVEQGTGNREQGTGLTLSF